MSDVKEHRPIFGPSAIATPANALTAARMVAAPAFAFGIVAIGPRSWWLWVIWIALACSDGLDGHLARRLGITSSGAFLDPLADKFLVLAALVVLADHQIFSWVPVIVIGGREVAMSIFRTRASRRQVSIPARYLAKWKTIIQEFAIGCALFPPFHGGLVAIPQAVLWFAMALTLYTGVEYIVDARRLIAKAKIAT